MNIFYFRITNNSEHYNHKRIKLIEAVEIAAQNKIGGGNSNPSRQSIGNSSQNKNSVGNSISK